MSKRILFDVGHPAQVHQFKHLYWQLSKQGWTCLFVAKDKDITKYLLETYELDYKLLSSNKKGLIKKILNLPKEYAAFYRIVKSFKPDFILSRFSIHSAHIAWLLGIPNIAFSDTEHTTFFHKLTLPFVTRKLTGDSYLIDLGKNHLRYKSNIELFYLHPSIFTPDASILDDLGVSKDEKYVIIRFVSWNAHHDVGLSGLTLEFKTKLATEVSKFAKVFITSEAELPLELQKYQLRVAPEQMHSIMSYSSLYIGEGGTMASEAACLGVPAIYVNSLDAGVFHDEANFDLLYSFRDANGVIEKAKELLRTPALKELFSERLSAFLKDKINPTAFVMWLLTNYPESLQKFENNPSIQDTFK